MGTLWMETENCFQRNVWATLFLAEGSLPHAFCLATTILIPFREEIKCLQSRFLILYAVLDEKGLIVTIISIELHWIIQQKLNHVKSLDNFLFNSSI